MSDTLSSREVAERLQISVATVHNWVKSGLLPCHLPFPPRKFDSMQVEQLATEIAAGRVSKLRARANKRHSDRRTAPFSAGSAAINRIVVLRDQARLNTDRVLFTAAMAMLCRAGEAVHLKPKRLCWCDFGGWRRKSVELLMKGWHRSFGRTGISCRYLDIFETAAELDFRSDELGLLLQLLRREGVRSRDGSYYTPSELIRTLLCRHATSGTLLDPGCGTGRFLLEAAACGWQFNQLYGVDVDQTAVWIATLNLLLAFPDEQRMPQIRCADSLQRLPFRRSLRFDLVAANPPWGRVDCESCRQELSRGNVLDAFDHFLLHAVRKWTACGGELTFILPESFLNIRRHAVIRELLLRDTTLLRIEHLGRRFNGVFTGAIALSARNLPPPLEHRVQFFIPESGTSLVRQRDLLAGNGIILRCGTATTEAGIVRKLSAFPHRTLAGHAEWALGIVTGNNRRFLVAPGTAGAEPVCRGPEVRPFRLDPATYWLPFTPEVFQQCAPERLYRTGSKLVYRFISRYLTMAVDRTGGVTLNSANSLIIESGYYPPEAVAALFNSSLYQLLFRMWFDTHKVLRHDLEQLPLPQLPASDLAALVNWAEEAARGDGQPSLNIENLLADRLELTPDERKLLTRYRHPLVQAAGPGFPSEDSVL